ncbi:hypothetical protein [Butyrivibrio sp. INlla16]|uniref:hypothetical protein n=1 Tax=Butyrivibrio sp. INlla16 TaxID=1520807 RepID=UPI000B88EF8E|nr:hypothetical protein [Butyrivibrio sp. INlla16]
MIFKNVQSAVYRFRKYQRLLLGDKELLDTTDDGYKISDTENIHLDVEDFEQLHDRLICTADSDEQINDLSES